MVPMGSNLLSRKAAGQLAYTRLCTKAGCLMLPF